MTVNISLDDSEDDCISMGRELRAAIRSAGLRVAQQARSIPDLNHHFLESAVGLLARTILGKAGKEGKATAKTGHKITLIATYFQGCEFTERLILEGQYAKAAASLKQDFEIVTRIEEIDAQTARPGKTPNVSKAPNGSAQLYGDLNSMAHPSNETLLYQHLEQIVTDGVRGVSPSPMFRKKAILGEFQMHCWLCYAVCRASVMVLMANYGEDDPFVQDCIDRFLKLQDAGVALEILLYK